MLQKLDPPDVGGPEPVHHGLAGLNVILRGSVLGQGNENFTTLDGQHLDRAFVVNILDKFD